MDSNDRKEEVSFECLRQDISGAIEREKPIFLTISLSEKLKKNETFDQMFELWLVNAPKPVFSQTRFVQQIGRAMRKSEAEKIVEIENLLEEALELCQKEN